MLKEPSQRAIERFVKDGISQPAELLELVGFKFRVAELRNMLKEKQLQVSGHKAGLIENDREGVIEATKGLKVLKSSEEGKKLAKHYFNQEKGKRENTEKEVLNLLGKRLFLRKKRTKKGQRLFLLMNRITVYKLLTCQTYQELY